MKIRAKANGNILEVSDEEGERLIATGIYEEVEADEVEDEPKPRRYKRRDLIAEE